VANSAANESVYLFDGLFDGTVQVTILQENPSSAPRQMSLGGWQRPRTIKTHEPPNLSSTGLGGAAA